MEFKITNYIEISGEDVPMDTLPEDVRQNIAEELQDKAMGAIGYKRKTA